MNKTKTKSKIILSAVVVILIFILVPAASAAKSTKLVFSATEFITSPPPDFPVPDSFTFIVGKVIHTKDFWSYHRVEGEIGGDKIEGYTFSIFHRKINMVTGNMVLNGKTWFYFSWYYDGSVEPMDGYFTGTINAKFVNGELSGKYSLQGFEAFEGMKLVGIVQGLLSPYTGDNKLIGDILIPN